MNRFLACTLAFVFGSADAALISRADGQAYYDDVLDITWLADANFARTTGYAPFDGGMTWTDAQAWIGTLNAASHLGVNTWRLPLMVDTGPPGCDFAFEGTDCGYNVQTIEGGVVYSELAHLYSVTLGNQSRFDTAGVDTGCFVSSPFCLSNTGPFSNVASFIYWTGTEYAPSPDRAWAYLFTSGFQNGIDFSKGRLFLAWAVSDGDFAVIPVPAALWMFGSALGLLGWLRRRSA